MTDGHAIEDAHAEDAAGLEYGEEFVIPLSNGREIRTDTYENSGAGSSYVRVVENGRELAYWNYEEWAQDPQLVMGAFLGCAGEAG